MSASMKRLYIMAASGERHRAAAFADRCRAVGWEITEPWWEHLATVEKEGRLGDDLPLAERQRVSEADLEGVYQANLTMLLRPSPGISTEGAWVELGYALGLRRARCGMKPLIWSVSDFPEARRFFTLQVDRHLDSEDAAIEALTLL